MYRILTTTLLLCLPALASAQFYTGEPKWDFSIGAVYQSSQTSAGSEGSSFAIEGEPGLGLSLNYHFNKRFALGGDFDFISPRYRAVIVSDDVPPESVEINHRASQFNGRIKGTFSFTDGPLVPYAQIGFGWTNFDSNVADGPPITGCWWHPWWGYICQNYFRTYSSTESTYGAALGLRYEFAGNSFLNVAYDYWEVDTGGDRTNPTLEQVRLQYGWRF
jgi:opacity protein-like surface antigen